MNQNSRMDQGSAWLWEQIWNQRFSLQEWFQISNSTYSFRIIVSHMLEIHGVCARCFVEFDREFDSRCLVDLFDSLQRFTNTAHQYLAFTAKFLCVSCCVHFCCSRRQLSICLNCLCNITSVNCNWHRHL